MLLSPLKFDAIALGETDWRAIDITKDCDGVAVSTLAWTCALAPGSSGGDPNPQARVLNSHIQTSITILTGPQNIPITRTGVFAVVEVGGFPGSAVGATYLLASQVTLTDGRVLIDAALMPCTAI